MHTYKQVLLALSALQTINGADIPRFSVKKNAGPVQTIQKRSSDGSMLFEITNQEDYYSVDVVLGSNNQSVTALLDTGSSDLWILGTDSHGLNACQAYLDISNLTTAHNSSEAQEIQEVEGNCKSVGTFTPSKSKTFKVEHPDDPFSIQYGDGTFAVGYWGSDSLSVNGVEVDSLLFGVANISDSTNVCGIGFLENESSNFANSTLTSGVSDNGSFVYKNLPYVMKDQGLINRVSYSLFLNALGAESGDLLFGAIDKSKYVGNLSTIPIVNIGGSGYDHPIAFDVTLQGVGYVEENGKPSTLNKQYFPALADSGTTLLNVPQDLGNLMAHRVGASYDKDLGFYMLDCPSATKMDQSAFVMQFGGENYFFPFADFILTTSNSSKCALGISPSDSQEVILGDNILSSLYVVYDLESYELSIARANYAGADSKNASDIVIIPSAGKAISLATKAPGYSKTWSKPVHKITSGGDIFKGAKRVSNPWAATPTKYFASFSSSGSYTTLSSSCKTSSGSKTGSHSTAMTMGSSTKTGSHSSGMIMGSSTKADGQSTSMTMDSTTKSKNGAGMIGGSLITLLAALFV